jgi:hypothetical protein
MPQVASWLRKNLLLLATFSGQSFSPPYTVKKVLLFSRPQPGCHLPNSISLACKQSDLNKKFFFNVHLKFGTFLHFSEPILPSGGLPVAKFIVP